MSEPLLGCCSSSCSRSRRRRAGKPKPRRKRARPRSASRASPRSSRGRLGDIPDDGEIFQRGWIEQIERRQLPETVAAVRYWDLAASEPGPGRLDPDYTVGLRLERDRHGSFYITNIVRERLSAGSVEDLVKATALSDGKVVAIWLEQEGGSAGKSVSSSYKRNVLRGFNVRTAPASGSKVVRARVVAAAAENGLVKLLPSRHADAFLDELAAFPNGPHDDCVDALAGAHAALATNSGGGSLHKPQGNIWEIAERAQQRGRPRRVSATIRAQQHAREQANADRLAGQLGISAYNSRQRRL